MPKIDISINLDIDFDEYDATTIELKNKVREAVDNIDPVELSEIIADGLRKNLEKEIKTYLLDPFYSVTDLGKIRDQILDELTNKLYEKLVVKLVFDLYGEDVNFEER